MWYNTSKKTKNNFKIIHVWVIKAGMRINNHRPKIKVKIADGTVIIFHSLFIIIFSRGIRTLDSFFESIDASTKYIISLGT